MSAAPNLFPVTELGQNHSLIYAPPAYAPFGAAIGVNLLGTTQKVCTFDCPYCDLGRTTLRLNKLKDSTLLPTAAEIEAEFTAALKKIHASGPAIDSILVSGNGEPTAHPDFPEIAKILVKARDLWQPGKKLILFSNGSTLDNRKVADAANSFDERIVKLDCGSEKLFKAVNAPLSRANLARVITGIGKLKDVTVQSLFFTGTVENISKADVDDWLEVIAIIKPKAVHLHGLSRKPATEGLVPVDEDTLYAIASRLERKTSIKAIVLP